MRQYNTGNLIVHPGGASDAAVITEVTPELAGWDYLHFQARRLPELSSWASATGEHEMALVLLSGRIRVESNRGQWSHIGERESVFSGLPHALYLPRRTSFSIHAETSCEYVVVWVRTDQDHEPRLVTPADVSIEIRGGDNATRQINSIIPPGFPCRHLIIVEVYTPGGNWSSYPPHKHDVHKTDSVGSVIEADLEEIYFYKLSRPEGYAFQRIYTDPESPLHRAGKPIDAILLAGENDAVLVPEGYHPVASPPGYTTYYLNALAGSAQSLANSEDPRYVWVKTGYKGHDSRIPVYDIERKG
ncbi:MAG TPA: 5-deoxy-glucuronate isomerase [Ktedonobacteraceae bacterium]|jgi:5-deoxy-glucuronate isomerase|nr:5-deoxy-glucuronate isomerase [Ktedonobacteraceae bacterium]